MVRVVAGKEEADVALLVERVAPGIAAASLEVVREALLYVQLQCIVCRNTNGLEIRRVGAEADIRCAEIRIAGVESVPGFNRNRQIVIVRGTTIEFWFRTSMPYDDVSPQIGLVGVAMPGSLNGIGITAWRPRLPE